MSLLSRDHSSKSRVQFVLPLIYHMSCSNWFLIQFLLLRVDNLEEGGEEGGSVFLHLLLSVGVLKLYSPVLYRIG